MVTTTGGGSTSLGPANPGEFPQLPAPYEWIVDSSGNENVEAGLRVVTADNKFNRATFQCIASFQTGTTSAPAATLEVTGIHMRAIIQCLGGCGMQGDCTTGIYEDIFNFLCEQRTT